MKNHHHLLLSIIFIAISCMQISAQIDPKKEALEKGRTAIQLMDNGRIDDAIKLLEECQKLDPKNIDYPYEIALASYMKQDYKKSIKILEGLKKHKDVYDRVYQLLGNAYDMSGSRDRAINTYELGLKKFPNSGSLYLERGNMEMMIKEYNKALGFYEKGIEMDPSFPSNYYWASKLFLSSQEEVWGMIYGEIFMNLERNSKRTIEISKLLYNTYLSEIKIKDSTSYSVSFSSNTIHISNPKDLKEFKIPYGLKVYEPTLMLCVVGASEINMSSLNMIRACFVDRFFEHETHSKEYPNVLFDYQKTIKEAGHFEAYTHWLMMQGNLAEFEAWNTANEDKWDAFIEWFSPNPIKITGSNKFFRAQY